MKPFRSRKHLDFVREQRCILAGKQGHVCNSPIRACHIRTGTDGGVSLKPSDKFTYPACDLAHIGEQHRIGEPSFEEKYGVNLKDTAALLWLISPARFDESDKPRKHKWPRKAKPKAKRKLPSRPFPKAHRPLRRKFKVAA